ncbi:putative low-complexity protein [Cylindrospermum stagnale PCC 7417]|uniref:Putative low-complexity protein n=1 Tax=Cylindrospermum stagnale PCC 7417 TaxID=56107 RepID=K9X2U8_9NOST|nr:pentapeptide repeat-containing protein [Cylindrospermum stagnale]AFZ26409.1 putative low-complexity protein [Cylindrospermum stagnale PCC 7417]
MNLSIRNWLVERYITINQIKEFSAGQMAGVAYRIVQDMEVKSLVPFDICTLVEVLELPLDIVWEEITTIALLTESLLRSLSQKKPLKRNEGTWLAFQIAYLHTLQQVLDQEASLQRTWLDRAMIPTQPELIKLSLQDAQLQGLLKTLSPGKLTDTQAEQALSLVTDSLLVQQINNVTVAWLVANGAEEPEAKLLTQRLVNSLLGHLLVVIANNAAPLAQLQKFVRLGNSLPASSVNSEAGLSGIASGSTVSDKIDLDREYYRASLLQSFSTPLLLESFALKDIYVKLTGLPVEESGSESDKKSPQPVDLITWAQQQLDNLATIAVIESEPGYGKTSFCQIWAAQVAQKLYPTWMPVLIRLRDVRYGKSLIETLISAFPVNLQSNLATWLEQDFPRCLLLLDGLDELPDSGQNTRKKALFIDQLLKLQSQGQHKIVLTGRSITMLEIPSALPLRRIIIQPLDVDQLKQWFQKWAIVQSLPIAQNFFVFLKKAGLFASQSRFSPLSTLIHQPLMLYLLGILHRDGLLDDQVLQVSANTEQTDNTPLLWEIYHRLSRWLLGYPQTGGMKMMLIRSGSAHIHRTPLAIANLLAGRHPQALIEQMQAIALKILHSDRLQVNLPRESNPHTLPSFYFRSGVSTQIQQTIKTEFSHPKLGEYLCAEAIAAQLSALTERQQEAYGKLTFMIESSSSVAQHLYNLLGYGILSQEIEELALEGLRRQQKHEFSFEVLFQRLESFWRDYCQGRWLDQGIVHKALTYFQSLQNYNNVEQVNAAVGLNVFLLLCAIYREAKVPFWPGGNPTNLALFNPAAVSGLIGRTTVLHKSAFAVRTRSKSLAGLNLSANSLLQVMLTGANLEGTNLSDAELIGANLAGANLQRASLIDANLMGANLTGANLTGANLIGANLIGANLTGANLMGVNLNSVNLTNACLFQANLADADKEFAALNGALFSKEDFPAITSLPSPEFLNSIPDSNNTEANTQIWVQNMPEVGRIESAEGVPILPVSLDEDDDYTEDETVLGNNPADGSYGYY